MSNSPNPPSPWREYEDNSRYNHGKGKGGGKGGGKGPPHPVVPESSVTGFAILSGTFALLALAKWRQSRMKNKF